MWYTTDMTNLNNVIGQERAKKMFRLLGENFQRRQKIPPIGIFGPSGLGKTHVVHAFAEWLGAKVLYINGTAIKDALAFRAFFKEAARNTSDYFIVFVDECHMLPSKVQENLLSVLEEPAILCTVAPKEIGNVPCVDGIRFIDKGDVMREALPTNMSFVLATTDPIHLKNTILGRLRKIHLEPYSVEEKAEIAMRHLMENGISPNPEIVVSLAERSRNIRNLKEDLCETFIDVQSLYGTDIDETLKLVDDMLGIDEDGATDMDKDYLEYLAVNKIAGIDTLAGILKTDKRTLITRIEPFLLEKGWVAITGKGRMLTRDGHVKMFGEGSTGLDAFPT